MMLPVMPEQWRPQVHEWGAVVKVRRCTTNHALSLLLSERHICAAVGVLLKDSLVTSLLCLPVLLWVSKLEK
jgi:hypothetical protein